MTTTKQSNSEEAGQRKWVKIEDNNVRSFGPPRRPRTRLYKPKANLKQATSSLEASTWDLLTDKEKREYLEKRQKSLDKKRGAVIQ